MRGQRVAGRAGDFARRVEAVSAMKSVACCVHLTPGSEQFRGKFGGGSVVKGGVLPGEDPRRLLAIHYSILRDPVERLP